MVIQTKKSGIVTIATMRMKRRERESRIRRSGTERKTKTTKPSVKKPAAVQNVKK